jgi:hypothetical protein
MPPIKVEDIQKLARDLSTTAASPEFLELIRSIHAADDDDKLNTARQVARVETLVEHGVSLPEDFRITTRTFEEPDSPKVESAESLPHIIYDGDRVVFIFDGLVTVVEVMHDHD